MPFATALALCLLMIAPLTAASPTDEQIENLAIGQKQASVLAALGAPSQRLEKGKNLVLTYEDLLIHLRNDRITEIHWTPTPPRERGTLIPPNLPVIELERERSRDVILPGRRFSHPPTGKTWIIGMHGKVEKLMIRAPWKSPRKGELLEKLLESDPPGEKSAPVRRPK